MSDIVSTVRIVTYQEVEGDSFEAIKVSTTENGWIHIAIEHGPRGEGENGLTELSTHVSPEEWGLLKALVEYELAVHASQKEMNRVR